MANSCALFSNLNNLLHNSILSISISKIADATNRIRNGDMGGAVLSGLSAIPGPIGWLALGTQMVTDGIGATGNRREEYIIETKTKDTFRDELQKMGGFDIEKGDWGAAFMDELAKTNEIKMMKKHLRKKRN